MQTVKRDLIKAVEAEGEFCRNKIQDNHIEELRNILSAPNVTYGDIKRALDKYKCQIKNK